MLTQEQADEIKKQLVHQLSKSVPPDKFEETKEYITQLSPKDLEDFLIRNKMMTEDQLKSSQQTTENIFKLIIEGKIKSYKIAESQEALAILEINPQSLGHTIIIPKALPKKFIEVKKTVMNFAKKLSKQLQKKLNSTDIKILPSEAVNGAIINLIPVYENGDMLDGKSTPEKLEELQKKLVATSSKTKTKKPKIEEKSETKQIHYKLPRRVP